MQAFLATAEEHGDLLLSVKGTEFHAHRSILMARSSVFRAMLVSIYRTVPVRVHAQRTRHARTHSVAKYQSCMS